VCFDDERGRLPNHPTIQSWSVRSDLRRLGGSDVDDERALGDRLAAERDRYDVFADLLRIIAALKRSRVHLSINQPIKSKNNHLREPLVNIIIPRLHDQADIKHQNTRTRRVL